MQMGAGPFARADPDASESQPVEGHQRGCVMSIKPRAAVEGRTVVVIVGAAVGAVLAVLAGAVLFPIAIAPLATCAIGAIGGVAGSGLAVLLAQAVGRRP